MCSGSGSALWVRAASIINCGYAILILILKVALVTMDQGQSQWLFGSLTASKLCGHASAIAVCSETPAVQLLPSCQVHDALHCIACLVAPQIRFF